MSIDSTSDVFPLSHRSYGLLWLLSGSTELDGSESPIPELTRLGTGGYECDVKLGEDGVFANLVEKYHRPIAETQRHEGEEDGESPDGDVDETDTEVPEASEVPEAPVEE